MGNNELSSAPLVCVKKRLLHKIRGHPHITYAEKNRFLILPPSKYTSVLFDLNPPSLPALAYAATRGLESMKIINSTKVSLYECFIFTHQKQIYISLQTNIRLPHHLHTTPWQDYKSSRNILFYRKHALLPARYIEYGLVSCLIKNSAFKRKKQTLRKSAIL